MRLVFFLYLPGHAGHFLARLFSLGPDTVPQLTKKLLSEALDTGRVPEVDRDCLYKFSTVSRDFPDWQTFHRAWTDYYQDHHLYHWLFVHNHRHSTLICPIHPHEFMLRHREIENETKPKRFYYVHLDDQFNDWVSTSQVKLRFVVRPNEIAEYQSLIKQYDMRCIDLGKMLESQQDMLREYHRVCDDLDISHCDDRAIKLYHDWRQVRYD